MENLPFISLPPIETQACITASHIGTGDLASLMNLPHRISINYTSVLERILPTSVGWKGGETMPLAVFLEDGYNQQAPFGWHRQLEQICCNKPVTSVDSDFAPWEMDLLFSEILLLTGYHLDYSVFLAQAWGRANGFHTDLALSICAKQAADLGITSATSTSLY